MKRIKEKDVKQHPQNRVIRIISDTELLFIYPEQLKKDDIIEVYTEQFTEVIDPFTKENLGNLDNTKEELIVTEVYPKFYVAKKTIRHTTKLFIDFENIKPLHDYKKLNVGDLVRRKYEL